MKYSILTTIFVLSFFASTRASMDCLWTASKQGVTLKVVYPCEPKYLHFADSILDQMLIRLNRKDTTLKVLVLVNSALLSNPNSEFSNFISIGFDTLRLIDDDFIKDYYFSKEGENKRKFPRLSEPLDINSTTTITEKTIGIKIIYRTDYRLAKTNWGDIEKIIQYALQNADEIKREQRRINVRYDYNGWYVSLVTLDTTRINNILNKKEPSKATSDIPKKSNAPGSYWLLGLLAVIVLGFVLYKFRTLSK